MFIQKASQSCILFDSKLENLIVNLKKTSYKIFLSILMFIQKTSQRCILFDRTGLNSFRHLDLILSSNFVAARRNASKTNILNILIKTGSFDKFDLPKLSGRPRADQKCNNDDPDQHLWCHIECYCLNLVTGSCVKMQW